MVGITVLMTVKNGEPYLASALESVLGQHYSNFKFLILDNASTDQSREIIKGYNDSRIELVALAKDLGQTGALNKGLELINTQYVARIDADDIAKPQRLANQMAFLKDNPSVGLVGSWYEIIDELGNVKSKNKLPTRHNEILNSMLFENQFVHSSVIFDRQAALASGGYNQKFRHAQDYALWWDLGLQGQVANYPDYLVQIREHAGQVTRFFHKEAAEEPRKIIMKAITSPQLPEACRKLSYRALGYAEIKYGSALSGDGFKSVRYALKGLLAAPELFFNKQALTYAIRAVMGQKGFNVLRYLKRLFSASNAP